MSPAGCMGAGGCQMMPQMMMNPMGQMQQMNQMMMMQAMMGQMTQGGSACSGLMMPQPTNAALAQVAAQKVEEEEDRDDDVPPGPSTTLNHPNYRPPDMEQVAGVTDKRFEGRIKMWFEDKSYGFIATDGLKEVPRFHGMDVFLHLSQKRHFKRGDSVTFNVFVNYRGQPQATELRRAEDSLARVKRLKTSE